MLDGQVMYVDLGMQVWLWSIPIGRSIPIERIFVGFGVHA